ncbi:hypothetical protein EPN81_01765 [Patescibacteria group bacterium]|nr:MAG: hypothetical protein EPN81_01765 [Patescibacteria group bacterium]
MAYGQGSYGGGRQGGNSYGGGRGSFGGNRGGFGGGYNKPSFPARCNECGNSCTVPFKPNGSKPVLCRECFRGNEGGGAGGFEPRRSFDRKPSFGGFNDRQNDRPERRSPSGPAPVGPSLKSEIQAINRKLDQILTILSNATVEAQEEDASEINWEETQESQETESTDIE